MPKAEKRRGDQDRGEDSGRPLIEAIRPRGEVRGKRACACEQEVAECGPVTEEPAYPRTAMRPVLPAHGPGLRVVIEEVPQFRQVQQGLACMRVRDRTADDVRRQVCAVEVADGHFEPQIIRSTVAIEVPKDVHRAGRTHGGRNTPEQIAKDAADSCGAVCRDTAQLRQNLISKGYDSGL